MAEKVTGKGWVGHWRDGDIGWGLPSTVHRNGDAGVPEQPPTIRGDDIVTLCDITITPRLDKLGRPIRRTVAALRKMKGMG